MKTLDSSRYSRLAPLIDGKIAREYLPSLHAVIEGSAAATVFADSVDEPTRALVALKGGWAFPLGSADADFARETMPALLAQCNPGDPLFAIWPTSTGWADAISTHYALWTTRVHFKYTGGAAGSRPEPPHHATAPIDFGAMAAISGAINPWLPDHWNRLAATTSLSFGYCVMIDGKIASAAWAGLVGMRVAQIDVATHPDYLRKGYGDAVCRALMNRCAEDGLEPYWSTDLANEPSMHMAVKLGFAPSSKTIAYFWCRQLPEPNPKWGSGLSSIKLNPPGSTPPVVVTMA